MTYREFNLSFQTTSFLFIGSKGPRLGIDTMNRNDNVLMTNFGRLATFYRCRLVYTISTIGRILGS